MPDPVIPARPSEFEKGDPISANLLNHLQTEILRLLVNHDHTGAEGKAQPLTTPGYTDKSVTEPKLADGAISARTVAAGAIGTDHIADDAIDGDKIADGVIDTSHIADDAVTEEKLSPDVRVLLRRKGDGASSYSQVIWRDPLVLVPVQDPDRNVIIDIWKDPQIIDWPLTGVILTPDAEVIEWEFGNDDVINPVRIDFEAAGGARDQLRDVIAEESVHAALDLAEVGAFREGVGTGFTDLVMDAGLGGTGNFGTVGTGGFGAGFDTGFGGGSAPMHNLRLLGDTAAGTPLSRNTEVRMAAGIAAHRMMRAPGGALAPSAVNIDPGAAPERLSSGMRISAAAPAAAEVPGRPGGGVPVDGAREVAAAAELPRQANVKLTDSGELGAARMSSLSAIDASGRPVPFESAGAMIVSAGFGGKEAFLPKGEVIDFTDLNTDHERRLASQAALMMLDNLGIETEELKKVDDKFVQYLADGDIRFWTEQGNPYITGTGWLGTILNWPTLFGTGYAISGGRNIQDVTTQAPNGLRVVRVRFITPYRNAAYSVSVTPAYDPDYGIITAHVRNKTTSSFEIVFGAQKSGDATITRINKLSFDLAVFGELQVGA